jgi:hypothetical protein
MTTAKPVKLGPFLGINNKLPAEKLKLPQEQGAFVRDAVNVDLTSSGTFQRRPGYAKVVTGSTMRSLYAPLNSEVGFYADGSTLFRYNGASATPVGVLSDAHSDVTYADTPLGIIWSDNVSIRLVSGTVSTPVVPDVPNPVPVVTVADGGALKAGVYSVAFAATNSSGQRSALSGFQRVESLAEGRIQIALPSNHAQLAVFVSDADGAILYNTATIPASATGTFTISAVNRDGEPVPATYEAPLPAGALAYYRGRLLSAVGNYIYYSQPYQYGVYRPASDFIALDGPVMLCKPTQTGVYLATANDTWFLDGNDVATAELKPLAPYGAIPGTVVDEPNALNAFWMSPRGIVHTKDDNTIELKQDANIAFGKADTGATMYREENGLSQVVSVLTNVVPSGAASASSYMDATTVN